MINILLKIYSYGAFFAFFLLGILSTIFPVNNKCRVPDEGFILALCISLLWPLFLFILFFAWLFDAIKDFLGKK